MFASKRKRQEEASLSIPSNLSNSSNIQIDRLFFVLFSGRVPLEEMLHNDLWLCADLLAPVPTAPLLMNLAAVDIAAFDVVLLGRVGGPRDSHGCCAGALSRLGRLERVIRGLELTYLPGLVRLIL